MTYHRALTLLHHYCLALYDLITCKNTIVSVGDILMPRTEASFVQFSTISRILDIYSYVEKKDNRFIIQDTLAKHKYGERYGKDYNHRLMSDHFSGLIDSFLENGYDEGSVLELDKEGTLTDGTHRVAMAIFSQHWELNARVLRRKSKYPHNLDYYYNLGLETDFLEKIYKQTKDIQEILINNGVSLGCLIYNIDESSKKNILADLNNLCDIKRIFRLDLPKGRGVSFIDTTDIPIVGYYILFNLKHPEYEYKKSELVSSRSRDIELLLRKRYTSEAKILFMNNCVRGKEMYDELQPYLAL